MVPAHATFFLGEALGVKRCRTFATVFLRNFSRLRIFLNDGGVFMTIIVLSEEMDLMQKLHDGSKPMLCTTFLQFFRGL